MKILSIGNSFSNDAHAYLHDICKSAGKEIYNVNLFIGGCSIEMHWDNLCNNEPLYDYEILGKAKKKISLRDALNAENWDVITIQQASHDSGKYETYQPYLVDLIREVRAMHPDAKIYVHKTWAYEIDSTHPSFVNYNSDQQYMYECLSDAYAKSAESIDADIIPTGDVIQYLRDNTAEFNYKNGGKTLNCDGFHLSGDYGRYAAALCWCGKLLDVDVREATFVPTVCADEHLVDVVKNAVSTVLKGE